VQLGGIFEGKNDLTRSIIGLRKSRIGLSVKVVKIQNSEKKNEDILENDFFLVFAFNFVINLIRGFYVFLLKTFVVLQKRKSD
jgi:hypothetical protein